MVEPRRQSPGDGLGRFSRAARELSKGPLGIIALFLVLVYAMAALVVGTGLLSAHSTDLLVPLVWFLAVFPVLVLVAFTLLVAFRHTHLYPPSVDRQFFPDPVPPDEALAAPAERGVGKKRPKSTRKRRDAVPPAPPLPEGGPDDPDRG